MPWREMVGKEQVDVLPVVASLGKKLQKEAWKQSSHFWHAEVVLPSSMKFFQ